MRFLAVTPLAALLACGSSPAVDAAPISPVVLPPALAQVLRAYEVAYSGRDSVALAALFASDGILLPLGTPPVVGHAAVAGELAREGGPLTLVPIAYGASDSVAYVIGTFGAERSAADGGKFLLALRRDASGRWRVAADIANPNGR